MDLDPSSIMNLVGQLGGDHRRAAQQMQGMGRIDSQQHAGLLNQFGVDPQQLENGGYQQHLDAQQQPGFSGYTPGQDYGTQQPDFGNQQGAGYQQQGGDYQTAGQQNEDWQVQDGPGSRDEQSGSDYGQQQGGYAGQQDEQEQG